MEAVLFTAGEPVSAEKLTQVVSASREAMEEALSSLQEKYRAEESGLRLMAYDGMVEIVTNPDFAPYLEEFSKTTMQEGLSKAALEVLSIIAYRGPVTRTEIEAIRGVNCQFSLRNLLLRGLIDRRDEEAARGYSYAVSFDFLRHLGLERREDLPDYEILSQDERLRSVVPEYSDSGARES